MKPFHVTDYLRDIDNEAMQIRRQIAGLQVRLQQLADMRVLMMTREEDRAAMAGHPSPFGALPSGVEISIRDPLTYQPAAALAAPPEAKTSSPRIGRPLLSEEEKREKKRLREYTPQRRDYKADYNKRKREERRRALEMYGTDDSSAAVRKARSDKGRPKGPGHGRYRQYRDQVERLFLDRPSTPLMTKEVMGLVFPGRVPDKAEKQNVYQCLYDLKREGIISQTQHGEPYSLVRPAGLGQAA